MENRVRAEREQRGLTQMELASKAGLHVSLVSRIENGSGCGVRTAQKLAGALGVAIEDLFPKAA